VFFYYAFNVTCGLNKKENYDKESPANIFFLTFKGRINTTRITVCLKYILIFKHI